LFGARKHVRSLSVDAHDRPKAFGDAYLIIAVNFDDEHIFVETIN